MTSLRSHIADILAEATRAWDDPLDPDAAAYDGVVVADALLADPTLAAIITLASDVSAYLTDLETVHSTSFTLYTDFDTDTSPQIAITRELLAAWRASRAEQEPER